MIKAKEIKLVVCCDELTVSLKKLLIPRDGLIQELDRLKQVLSTTDAETFVTISVLARV